MQKLRPLFMQSMNKILRYDFLSVNKRTDTNIQERKDTHEQDITQKQTNKEEQDSNSHISRLLEVKRKQNS